MSKIENGGLDQYGEVSSLNRVGGEKVKETRSFVGQLVSLSKMYVEYAFSFLSWASLIVTLTFDCLT